MGPSRLSGRPHLFWAGRSWKESFNSTKKEIQMDPSDRAQNIQMKRLFTIKELITEFGGTDWFWRSQIWDRRIPYVQVRRKILIDRHDIEQFITKHKIFA